MPSFVPIKPIQHERFRFFYYIISDENGRIGSNYVNFHNTLSYFLTITPEEFHNYYMQFKRIYLYNREELNSISDRKDDVSVRWLPEDENESLRCVKEIYSRLQEEIKRHDGRVLSEEECPKTFRLARDLWLYIWH
jgi:hypothetical protein